MWFPVLVLLALGGALWFWLRRSTELFVLASNEGRVRFVRGRIPPALLRELSDVLERAKSSGTLRVVVERREPRVLADGDFSAGTEQRLRNVIGTYPIAKIRAGAAPRK